MERVNEVLADLNEVSVGVYTINRHYYKIDPWTIGVDYTLFINGERVMKMSMEGERSEFSDLIDIVNAEFAELLFNYFTAVLDGPVEGLDPEWVEEVQKFMLEQEKAQKFKEDMEKAKEASEYNQWLEELRDEVHTLQMENIRKNIPNNTRPVMGAVNVNRSRKLEDGFGLEEPKETNWLEDFDSGTGIFSKPIQQGSISDLDAIEAQTLMNAIAFCTDEFMKHLSKEDGFEVYRSDEKTSNGNSWVIRGTENVLESPFYDSNTTWTLRHTDDKPERFEGRSIEYPDNVEPVFDSLDDEIEAYEELEPTFVYDSIVLKPRTAYTSTLAEIIQKAFDDVNVNSKSPYVEYGLGTDFINAFHNVRKNLLDDKVSEYRENCKDEHKTGFGFGGFRPVQLEAVHEEDCPDIDKINSERPAGVSVHEYNSSLEKARRYEVLLDSALDQLEERLEQNGGCQIEIRKVPNRTWKGIKAGPDLVSVNFLD